MMKLLRILLLLSLSSVCSFAEQEPVKDPTPYQKAYYLEHRLLPKLVHHTEGRFYSDLKGKDLSKIKGLLKEILGDRAAAIHFDVLPDKELIIVEFPAPQQPVECYFAAIAKVEGGFRYLTLEMTEDILGQGIKACLGEWTADASHHNLGPTTDVSKAEFLKYINIVLESKVKTQAATLTRPKSNS